MYSLYCNVICLTKLYFIKDSSNNYLCLGSLTLQNVKDILIMLPVAGVHYETDLGELIITFNSIEELVYNYPELFI